MLAARLQAAGKPLVLEQVPLPQPRGSEVRVRVAACGVCHTDLHIVRGELERVTLPLTLGHEISGWVDAWGSEAAEPLHTAGLAPGDPVLVFGGWGCGSCAECRAGEEQRCPRGRSPGFQADGGYAEALIVPNARHLVPLRGLDPVQAAPLADAGLTSYRAARRAAPWLTEGARVLLIGFGGLGQFALQHLRRQRGLRIIVVDTNPEKVRRAAELGTESAGGGDSLHHIVEQFGGRATAVLDFVGTDETLALGAEVVAPGGLVMLVGEAGGHLPFGFDSPSLESWLSTTAWGSLRELQEVVALARSGELTWEVETMPLARANEALAELASGSPLGRIVLLPGPSG